METSNNLIQQGNEYIKKKEYDNALVCFKKALELDINNKEAWEKLRDYCDYHSDDEYPILKDYFNKLLKKHPNEISLLSNIGCFYSSKEFDDEAVKYHKKAVELAPNNAKVWSDLASASMYSYDIGINTTLEYCNKALELNPNNWELLNDMVFEIYIDKDPIKSIELLEKVMLIDGADIRNTKMHLANLYKKTGDTEKAIKLYESELELYADDYFALEGLGYSYYKMENFEKTIEYLEKAIVQQSSARRYTTIWEMLVHSYCETGKEERIITLFKKLVQINQKLSLGPYITQDELLRGIAGFYLKKDDPEKLLQIFTEIFNSEYDAWKNMAHMYDVFSIKEFSYSKTAINCYEQALEIQPNDIKIMEKIVFLTSNTSGLMIQNDQLDDKCEELINKSYEYCQRILEIDPQNESAIRYLERFYQHYEKFENAKSEKEKITEDTLVKFLVNKIANYNCLTNERVGFSNEISVQYKRFSDLYTKATIEELEELLEHENGVVRCYSFWGLIHKYNAFWDTANKGFPEELFELLLKKLNDNQVIDVLFGVFHRRSSVSEMIIEYSSNYLSNEQKIRLADELKILRTSKKAS